MRSISGYASIWCIFFHQLQPRDSMAPITRGLLNAEEHYSWGYFAVHWAIFVLKSLPHNDDFSFQGNMYSVFTFSHILQYERHVFLNILINF